MFYEFRQYTIKNGKRNEWVKFMEEEIIPFQVSKGMVILGSFIDEEDDKTYYWIRRFKNEKDRERLYKAVYESDHWVNNLAPVTAKLIDKKTIKVKRIVPTPRSVVQ